MTANVLPTQRIFHCTALALLCCLHMTTGDLEAQVPELYRIDRPHALLQFNVRLIGFNRVRGTFETFRGDVLLVDDNPARSAVTFVAYVNSVRTGEQQRDEHLQQADFFDAERWPHITFVSHRVEPSADGFVAIGPLTIRDVTREIRVPFQIIAPKSVDPFGNTRISAAGSIVINRRDFGVNGPAFWNRAISDSVHIEFEMPGRRWNYSTMGFGPQDKPNGGRLVLEAISARGLDAAIADGWQQFTTHRSDSTYNFAPFEYEKAAGQLAQDGKMTEALAVIDLGIRVATALDRNVGRGNLHVQMAELLMRSGQSERALDQARLAAHVDPANTAAMVLLGHLSR